jgi:XTP/dITP diphosphohydrolase
VRALLASSNPHKAEELARSLPGWEIGALGVELPPETGSSYYENARAKAEFGHGVRPGEWILGEDSGIEVAGLGGRPGIHSARWAAEPVSALLAELRGVEGDARRARYVCELVCRSPEGSELRGRGRLEGRVAEEPRGGEGFGYDPIFVPEGETQTVAELGNAWKAKHSHRARAARALAEALGDNRFAFPMRPSN